MSTEPSPDRTAVELAALHSRVAGLEAELAEQARRTAGLVSEAEGKLRWFELWDVDLERFMARPGAVPALDALKRVRRLARAAKRLRRRLLGGS